MTLLFQSMEGKKIGQIQERISRWLVLYPMIQQIVINLHTKYDLHANLACMVVEKSSTKEIHSSKYGMKENWTNTGKNNQEKTGSQSNDTTCRHQPAYQY